MRLHSGIVLLVILFLSACAAPPPSPENIEISGHQAKLTEFVNWKIRGRLAFKSETEKFSTYMNWQQSENAFELKLSSTLGITLLEMQSDENITKLEADDKEYQGQNASQLIRRVTGWNIPMTSLPLWIKGQVEPSDQVEWNDNGLVQQLVPVCFDCGQWQISFSRYKQQGDLWLPHQITLQNQQQAGNTIKIRITSWQKT